MKKLLTFAFVLALFPSFLFAGTYSYTNADVSIVAQTTAATANVTLEVKSEVGPTFTSTLRPVRLLGLEVWKSADLSSTNSIYKLTNTAGQTRTSQDSRQTHSITGLLPNTTYYFKYFYGTEVNSVSGTYNSKTSATTYTFKTETNDSPATQPYSISAIDSTGALITVAISAPTAANDTIGLLVRKDTQGGALGSLPNTTSPGFVRLIPGLRMPTGLSKWTYPIGDLVPNTTYYIDLVRMSGTVPASILAKTSAATTATERIYHDELQFIKQDGRNYLVKGKIDTTKHPTTYKSLDIVLETSRSEGGFTTDLTVAPPDAMSYKAYSGSSALPLSSRGIADNGDYYFFLTALDKHATYHFRQIITSPSGAKDVVVGMFNTDRGFIIPGSAADEKDFEQRSYRLLAPLPGLSVLLDPDLCAERIAAGKAVSGTQICDVNEFLNFVFRLMIGICAVMLVIRLIVEGYRYATTDVPFLKVATKQKIFESFAGLLLALSAFLILNTLNPKLVENDISIEDISLEVPQYPEISDTAYTQITGKPVLPKGEYVAMAQQIATREKVDQCLLIASITAESNWRAKAMGSDADFIIPKNPTRSRQAFVNSGVKYSGATFAKGDQSLVNSKSLKNDTLQTKTIEPKIDWRFSAGFGIAGINFFPEGYFSKTYVTNPPPLSKKDAVPLIDKGFPLNPKTNKGYTPAELMDPENALTLATHILKKKIIECGNDPTTVLRAYNTGSCSDKKKANGMAVRLSEYNKCKGIK